MSTLGLIKGGVILGGKKPPSETPVEELKTPEKKDPVPPSYRVTKYTPISPSICEVILEFTTPQKVIPGQYMVFELMKKTYHLSINRVLDATHLGFILGGSSLTTGQVQLMSYMLNLSRTGAFEKSYRLAGKSTIRVVGKHPTLMIASGTGMSYINPIFMNQYIKTVDMMKEDSTFVPPKLNLIWCTKDASFLYGSYVYTDMMRTIPSNVYEYHPVVEESHKHLVEVEEGLQVECESIYNKITSIYEDTSLSKHLIYIGGSGHFVTNISKFLIENYGANPLMIISDNYIPKV